jgi:hypothetical protein
MLSIVEWGIGMDLLEFLSKATDNEHCIHTSAYPNKSAQNLDMQLLCSWKILLGE